jgi:hypothetical protein
MNNATLERLMIDTQLDEADADVRDLLDAYLALQPEEAAALASTTRLLQSAGKVLCRESLMEADLPPLRNTLTLPPTPAISRMGRTWPRLAIAASVLIAFFIGQRLERAPSPEVHDITQATLPPISDANGVPFWSVGNLVRHSSPQHAVGVPLRWNSPLTLPEPGEKI